MKILVIDDQCFVHDIFSAIVENEKVDHATNAYQALNALQTNKCYEHIFLDLKMENGSGAEFITKYKGKIPITIISSCDSQTLQCAESIARKIGINITRSIMKPIKKTDIEQILKESNLPTNSSVQLKNSGGGEKLDGEKFNKYVTQGALMPYFQTQYCLKQAKVIGAEMLCRISTASGQLISPAQFIHHMEKPENHGASIRLFNEAVSLWRNHPSTNTLSLSLNIFPSMLSNSDFVRALIDLKLASKNTNLIIEITETLELSFDDLVLANMLSLKMAGYRISIDDFGNQYSNLYRVSNFTIDELKIDASYINDITNNDRSKSIVHSIIKMTEDLKIDCVVEGVETLEQVTLLKTLGATKVQGYYLSLVLSFEALTDSLDNMKKSPIPLKVIKQNWTKLVQLKVDLEHSPLAKVTLEQQRQERLFIILTESIRIELAKLLEINSKNQLNKVAIIAHKIKGTARMGGLSPLSKMAEHLEQIPEDILNRQTTETIEFYLRQFDQPLSIIKKEH